jgi:hypothetical protein
MPLFRPRTRVYEAIQLDRVEFLEDGSHSIHLGTKENLPQWLVNALIDDEIVAKIQGDSYLTHFIEGTEVHIHPGDWIMYQGEVGIFVVSGNELLEDFEPIPAPVRQDATVQVTGVEATGSTLTFEGTPV